MISFVPTFSVHIARFLLRRCRLSLLLRDRWWKTLSLGNGIFVLFIINNKFVTIRVIWTIVPTLIMHHQTNKVQLACWVLAIMANGLVLMLDTVRVPDLLYVCKPYLYCWPGWVQRIRVLSLYHTTGSTNHWIDCRSLFRFIIRVGKFYLWNLKPVVWKRTSIHDRVRVKVMNNSHVTRA